jgi:hypothetical protein
MFLGTKVTKWPICCLNLKGICVVEIEMLCSVTGAWVTTVWLVKTSLARVYVWLVKWANICIPLYIYISSLYNLLLLPFLFKHEVLYHVEVIIKIIKTRNVILWCGVRGEDLIIFDTILVKENLEWCHIWYSKLEINSIVSLFGLYILDDLVSRIVQYQ